MFTNRIQENKDKGLSAKGAAQENAANKAAAIQFLNAEKKQYLGALTRSPSRELANWIESSLKTIVALLNVMHGLMPADKDALFLAKEIDRRDSDYPIIKTLLDMGLPKELLEIVVWENDADKDMLENYNN